jgi:hypothetical protein
MEVTTLPGSFSKANASVATPCKVGEYNPYTAANSCIVCPAGFYCNLVGTSDLLLDCTKGHYCPANSSKPTPCLAGSFNNEYNGKQNSDCKLCLPGHYCKDRGSVDPSGKCD